MTSSLRMRFSPGIWAFSVLSLMVACGDDDGADPADRDMGADATRIDAGTDATTPPPPPGDASADLGMGDDASAPPDDASTGDDSSVPPDDASVPPDDAGEGRLCGTRGAGPCGRNEYCDYVEGSNCGALDEGGSCRPRPTACDDVLDPVCGCDGVTYSNPCEAAAMGIDFARRGDCGGTPTEPSCLDTPCPAGLTCVGGPTCGDTWRCAALGRPCTDDAIDYCGCDGTTFADSSTCPRRAYAWEGTCERPMGLVSCDRAMVTCRAAEPVCPSGQGPSVLGSCWGPCVAIDQCACIPGEIRDTCPRGASGCGSDGRCMP